MKKAKFKIPPRRVPSDDCVIITGRKIEGGKIVEEGTPHRVHEGEWVEIHPVLTLLHRNAIGDFYRAMLNASGSVTDEGQSKALNDLCTELAGKVLDWNWTGLDSEALPKPYNNPDAIKDLSEDELIWLMLAVMNESAGERKNE